MKKIPLLLGVVAALCALTIAQSPQLGETSVAATISSLATKSPFVNVKAFGALGDGLRYQDATVTNGATMVSASGSDTPFTSSMAGWTVLVFNGAASGATLVTTISSVNVATQTITLATAASCGSNCPASGSALIEAGPDDSTAIANAVSSLGNAAGTLYFPAGIYITKSALNLASANGAVRVIGDGDPGTTNYGYGTRIVYAGTAGGAPAAGSTVALLTMGGHGWQVENLRLDGGGLVTYDLWAKAGTESSPLWINFSDVERNLGLENAKYWGEAIGADQATAYTGSYLLGMLTLDNVWWYNNGSVCQMALSNCSGNDLTNGGGIFLNYGSGNFNVQIENSQGTVAGAALGYGGHSIYMLSGSYVKLDNVYLPPLGTKNNASVYLAGGANYQADAVYDENGYDLAATSFSGPISLTNITTRSNTVATSVHQAMMLIGGGSRYTLRHVHTGGLPVIVTERATINAFDIGPGPLDSSASQVASCPTVTPTITTNVEKFTLNQAAQPFGVGDYIQVVQADSVYNGAFKVTAVGTGACGTNTYATVSFANTQPNGSSMAAGYIQFAQGVIATNSGSGVGGGSPFVGLDSTSAYATTNTTLASAIQTALTNPTAQVSLLSISPLYGGANGSSLPTTLPSGTNIFDTRGGTPEFYAASFWGGERGTFCLGCVAASETPSSHNSPLEELATTISDKTIQRFYNSNTGGDFRSDWSFGSSTFNWEDVRTSTLYCLSETATAAPLCVNISTGKVTLGDTGFTLEVKNTSTFDNAVTVSGTLNATILQQGGQGVSLSGANGLSTGRISISAATSGFHTFTTTYSAAPVCTATPAGATPPATALSYAVSSTTTAVTVTLSASGTATFNFQCSPSVN